MSDDRVQIISLSHHQTLLEEMRQLRNGGHLCDITVQVDYQGEMVEFEAHRVMLAASCGYFKSILLADESVKKAPLCDVPAIAFEAFLQYVYTGQVEVARSMMHIIFKMAELLECVDLVDSCRAVKDLAGTTETKTEPPDSLAESEASQNPPPPKRQGRKPAPSKSKADLAASVKMEKAKPPKAAAPGKRLSSRLSGRRKPVGRPKAKRARRRTSPAGREPGDAAQEEDVAAELEAAVLAMDDNTGGAGSSSHTSGSNSESSPSVSDGEPADECRDGDFHPDGDADGGAEEGQAGKERRKAPRVEYPCDKCEKSFLYEKSFLKHMSVSHGEQPEVTYRCGTCQQTFANRCNLKIHEQHVHSEVRLYPCDVCSKAFKRKKDVTRHRRQVHEGGGERHHCPVCKKALSSRTALKLHERTHTGYKPYECLECGAKFSQSSALKTHHRTHTGEKPFACDQCDARFTQNHMLAYHKRCHTGEKPFMCDICGKNFASKEYLKHHARLHSGFRPYKCDVCERAFAQRNSLHQHTKTHTGERPYHCTDCDKKFTQLNALQRHQRIHTGEKPYMCTLCNRTFTDKSTLRRHAMTHDKETPWRNFLKVLKNNVEDAGKKSRLAALKEKPVPKEEPPEGADSPPPAQGAKGQVRARAPPQTQTQTQAAVTAEPVTLSADWASHGTITLVSHGALSGFTVIQAEVPAGTQLQPLVTADGAPVTVPIALPIAASHAGSSSSSSSSTTTTAATTAVPIAVPVSEATLAPVQGGPGALAGSAAILSPETVTVEASPLEEAMVAGEIQCVTVGEAVQEVEEDAVGDMEVAACVVSE